MRGGRARFDIEAVGVDISEVQLEIARTQPRVAIHAIPHTDARSTSLPRLMAAHGHMQLAASGRFAQF
jgi:hypothetical protein